MKRLLPLSDPRVGDHTQMGSDVILNALTGRTLVKRFPTEVGAHGLIRSGTVLYAATRIGTHFESGHHVVVREENHLGNHVSIWNNTTIDYGCKIGHRVKIHCNCYVAQYSTLEDDVFLAPGVTLANDPFPGNRHAARVLQGPHIEKGAQLGVNVTVLPGIRIGKHAIIGAGSVVTKDIPAYAVVWGNPARIHKSRQELKWPQNYKLSRADANHFYQQKLKGKRVF